MTVTTTVAAVAREYDEDKFTEMVLYCAQLLEADRFGGATKLDKVLYFADFAHIRKTGTSISGAEYQKLPQRSRPETARPGSYEAGRGSSRRAARRVRRPRIPTPPPQSAR